MTKHASWASVKKNEVQYKEYYCEGQHLHSFSSFTIDYLTRRLFVQNKVPKVEHDKGGAWLTPNLFHLSCFFQGFFF